MLKKAINNGQVILQIRVNGNSAISHVGGQAQSSQQSLLVTAVGRQLNPQHLAGSSLMPTGDDVPSGIARTVVNADHRTIGRNPARLYQRLELSQRSIQRIVQNVASL